MHDDAKLLKVFIRDSDPEAFAALVARLGPSVLRICRTILDDDHLAEDAFQATFLVLFKRASAIQDPDALRGWVCGTAYKTAARLRRRTIRVSQHERPCEFDAPESEQPSGVDQDLFRIVREELELLPEKYRAPLILCHLEGLTHEQAAAQLNWATGTLKVRLVRGRRMLRERLDRRKVALGASLILLWRREAGAADPNLLASTVRAAEATPPRRLLATHGRPLNWQALCRKVLLLLVGFLAAATAVGAIARLTPPPADAEAEALPDNLKDVFGSDCA